MCQSVSPDGKSIFGFDNRGQAAIYSVEGIEKPRLIPELNSDAIAGWSSDGKSLYVYPYGEFSMKVSRFDIATGRKELLKEVRPSDAAGIYTPPIVMFTPDGKGYVYTVRRILMDLYLVDGLK
jgi:Tol biopolymer transport system component